MQSEHLKGLAMLRGQAFLCRQQDGVTPVAASSLVGFIWKLGCALSSDPAGTEAWAPIPGIAHVAHPWHSSHTLPLPALCVSVDGDTYKLLPYGANLILLVCVSMHSHSEAQIGNIKEQTGLFLKLPSLKRVECDSVCVADKILHIGHSVLCFLCTYVKYLLPSLRVLVVHVFPAVFCCGCFQLQQVKRAQQHLLEGACVWNVSYNHCKTSW